MANITLKLYGVMRLDSTLNGAKLEIEKISDIFPILNKSLIHTDEKTVKDLSFGDVAIFINGERCKKKGHKLADGDEVWLMSPSGGG